MPMTQDQQFIRIKDKYREANGDAYASLRTMLDWAAAQTPPLFQPDLRRVMSYAVEAFGNALRSETTLNKDGNEIRVNLPFLDPQLKLWQWDERGTISHEHMQLNVNQGLKMAYNDVRATVLSANDYHERHPDRPQLQMSLDFEGMLLDDGITVPSSSIEIEQLIAPHLQVVRD
jgi:hypothetical protein